MKYRTDVLVNGLILTGGNSARMGTNKSDLDYHGIPHGEYLFSLLSEKTAEVYVSAAKGHKVSFTARVIKDILEIKSPMNGIVSAFTFDPDSAWLVLAVDLPLITANTIELLRSRRDPTKMATCLTRKGAQSPEPLVAIWEPKAFPVLKEYVASCNYSPKSLLLDHVIELVEVDDNAALFNANEKDHYHQAKKMIESSYPKFNS